MDMTTLEKPHSTEMSVMEEGSANLDRCANFEPRMDLLRFSARLAFFSSKPGLLPMAPPTHINDSQ
jgi:hypothetical protein